MPELRINGALLSERHVSAGRDWNLQECVNVRGVIVNRSGILFQTEKGCAIIVLHGFVCSSVSGALAGKCPSKCFSPNLVPSKLICFDWAGWMIWLNKYSTAATNCHLVF
jgi:hypothetical protein